MAKRTTKKAETAVTDADKFPIESLRERLARRFGLDAVALSGPCEGSPLVDCVCDQLKSRWNNINKRLAGNKDKLDKLATRLAKSLLEKDDSDRCVKDLEEIKFSKEAAVGVAGYLKSWHIKQAMDDEIEEMIIGIDEEPEEEEDDLDELAFDDMEEDEDEIVEMEDDLDLEPKGEDDLDVVEEPGLEPALPDDGKEMVTIELPVEVAEEIVEAIEGYEHEIKDIDTDEDLEIIELEPEEDEPMLPEPEGMEEENLGEKEPEIPGESMEDGKQIVEGGDGLEMEPEGDEPEALLAKKEKAIKEAAMGLKAGRISKVGQSILKIGPEMSINNTDQLAGGKDLGDAKNKDVEDPKALDQSNIKPEGFMAGGKKVQDGKTMGKEEAFDAKKVSPEEVSGGKSSLMGDDESYPEKKPEVPAGSASIGNEEFSGGDVSTKGTVIATITPKGIMIKAEGHKNILAKTEIKEATKELVEAVGSVKYDGDPKKFAKAILKAIKEAKAEVDGDGICKTDTSKLEAENFTNDAEKKADGDTATSSSASKEEPVCETNTSKLEDEKFTNDAEKKPEPDKAASGEKEVKQASAEKEVKTAADEKDPYAKIKAHEGDKKVEEPKALDKSNIKPEGYMAGGKGVSATDGSVQGNEEKFTAHEVAKTEVSGGDSSLQGPDESLPKDGAEVPAGGGKMGNEEWEGGNVSTKGTTIAGKDDQDEVKQIRNEQRIREARLKAASVLVADMLANGEVTKSDYEETLETYSKMEIPALQALAVSIRKVREKVEARIKTQEQASSIKQAGLGIPVVHDVSRDEKSLPQRLSELFSINKVLNPESYDSNGRKKG